MIALHRINGSSFMVNPDHIETVEATPDTVVLLHNGHRYVVRETPEEVRRLVVAYRQEIFLGAPGHSGSASGASQGTSGVLQ
ncbi:MAG TPA: flagellar FlbD family protein [Synergistaceae bacterium]|nr:flagellar FlbD family protein [Synergistaceae bacterium]HPJ26164.1 flagellar FlbD family protein [Synergistaceae bacterium]HPQ38503.1 flagellar FlbD family protein [Synergistaceae bacterium]